MRYLSSWTVQQIALVVVTVISTLHAVDPNMAIQDRETALPRYRHLHHQLLSEIDLAMDVALKFSSLSGGMLKDQEPVIHKCIGRQKALKEVWTSIDEKRVRRAMVMLWEISDMYHVDKNRNSDDFYELMNEDFPDIYESFGREDYKECFRIFSQLQGMFENYREDMQQETLLGLVKKKNDVIDENHSTSSSSPSSEKDTAACKSDDSTSTCVGVSSPDGSTDDLSTTTEST